MPILSRCLGRELRKIISRPSFRYFSSKINTPFCLKKEFQEMEVKSESDKINHNFMKTFLNIQKQNEDDITTFPSYPKEINSSILVPNIPSFVTEKQLREFFPNKNLEIKIFDSKYPDKKHYVVYFQNLEETKNAFYNLNYKKIGDFEVRLKWCLKNHFVIFFGSGNIIVKNLNKAVTNRTLMAVFSIFGNVYSCKISRNFKLDSKGYGFVHFEDLDSAKTVIEKVNGLKIGGETLEVSEYVSRRKKKDSDYFTNVIVRNFIPQDFPDENEFRKFFEKFGEISSVFLPPDGSGAPKGFGYVDFKEHPVALKVTKMNLKKGKSSLLIEEYINLNERMLDKKFNLFVYNIPRSVHKEALEKKFSQFGKIVSSKVFYNNENVSKGFGFVLFSEKESAEAAIKNLNETVWNGYWMEVRYSDSKASH